MKFYHEDDVRHFLVEVGRVDLATGPVAAAFEPTDEMVSSFIKGRRGLTSTIKNFRKAQVSREAWRKNRYKYMKGIRGFHRSVEGKRFHRALGRFLSTRDTSKNRYKRESHEEIADVCEALKALSSLRTHAYICCEYFRPIEEEVDYQIFLEELLPSLDAVEGAMLHSDREAVLEDLDFLVALTEPKAIFAELGEAFKVSPEKAKAYWNLILEAIDMRPETAEASTGRYLEALNWTKRELSVLTDAIILVPLGIKDGAFAMEIEGTPYVYRSKDTGVAIEAIVKEFMELLAHGTTGALTWLKSVTTETTPTPVP